MATKDLVVRILGDASNFNKALAGIGNSASVTGAKLTKNLTPAAAAVGLAMGKIGSSFNDARDAIIVGTGASGKALDGLMASSKRVAGRVPNDFGQVGQAIADVNTRLGLTGPELETVSKKALDLSRITKTDVSTNIRAAARVTRDWGLEATEAADVMDMMFKASQSTGIGFDRLGDSVVQFGAPLRAFGFSMEESVALLAGFEAQGVNTEAVMAGLRQGLGRIARAGEEPIDVLARVSEEIKNAGSAGEANGLALEVFGSRAGPDMAAAIREGRFEIADLVATLGDSEGSIDSAAEGTLRFSDRLAMMRNRVVGVLGPFGEFGGVAGGAAAALGPLIFGLGQMAPLLGKVRGAMIALKVAMVGHPILALATVAVTVGAALAMMGGKADTAKQSIDDMADAMSAATDAGEGLADWLATFAQDMPVVERALDAAGVTLTEVADAAMEGGAAWESLSGKIADASDAVADNSIEQKILQLFLEKLPGAANEASDAMERRARVDDRSTDATKDLTDATEDATEATDDATEATERYIRRLSDHERAVGRVTNRYERLRDELSDRSAYLTAQQGLSDLLEQAVETGDVTEEQINDMKIALLDYGESLDDVAGQERVATLVTELDQSTFMATAIALESLERQRTVRFLAQVQFPGGYNPRQTPGQNFGVQPEGAGATGAIINRPTVMLAGEDGPEALIPLNKTPGNSPLPGMGSPTTVNIHVNGGDPVQVVAALRKYVRHNGPIRGLT